MKVGIVETSDISIVVQGPIVSNRDFYPNAWTNEALRRMRIHFPGAEIILSTWKGSNVDGLDYDVVVFNDDPGSAMSRNRPYNVNRQIVSTKNGLAKASRKYALKTRTDMIFNSNIILSYFGKYPERIDKWKVFKERVITYTANNPRRYCLPAPFLIADFLHFGLREDVTSLWDIPLAPPEFANWFEFHPKTSKHKILKHTWCRYAPEQYIWINFLKKFGDISCSNVFDNAPQNIYLTELIVANNLVLLDFNMMGIDHLKFIGNKETGETTTNQRGRTLAHFVQDTLAYSHYEWNRLREKYCLGKQRYLPHLRYDILYPSFANLYIFLRSLKEELKSSTHST